MKIVLSETMGYCKGVSRALEMAGNAVVFAKEQGKSVYSLGALIHNSQVCDSFARQGLVQIESPKDHDPGVLVLRAHGVADGLRVEFERAGYELVDATCPVVKRNLERIAFYSKTHAIIIVGHEGHPETVAMQGVMVEGKPIETLLVSCVDDLPTLAEGKAYAVFVQTTFDQGRWETIKAHLQTGTADRILVQFINTVCPSSLERRAAVLALVKVCDAVLVIGGKHSANTKALFTLVRQEGKKAWHIEDETEIVPEMKSCDILGVTAGASTPPSVIQQVIESLQQE
ncbi:MAG: 4-hydroxy-3-methylbut-2-enyl diphosphate reductase [Spirochaetia bacterium]|nr:4-hydroxy-3-methylbut-2-enyl diphosphate reductase [Spirochaetia bacterium]